MKNGGFVMNDTKNEVNNKDDSSKVVKKRSKSGSTQTTPPSQKQPTSPPSPGGAGPQGQPLYGPSNGYAPPQIHHHYYYEAPRPRKDRSSKPTIAGALLILTAILGIVGSIFMVGAGMMFSTADTEGFDFWGMTENDGDVLGQVTYLNGTGVEGATVTIIDEDMSVQTDEDGYYIIYDVPSGNQELKVEKDEYNTYIKKIFVSPRNTNMDPNSNNDGSHENEHNFELTDGSETIERGEYPPWGLISGFIIVCAFLVVIFSVIALIGGIFAIKRKKFGLAVAGSILGIFTIIGAIFSIIALFILIISRKEFRRESEINNMEFPRQ
jgi:hypothetical protein